MIDTIVGGLGTASGFVAAILWIYASMLEVPDNIDTIVRELKRISAWNAGAAWATAIAAGCTAFVSFRHSF